MTPPLSLPEDPASPTLPGLEEEIVQNIRRIVRAIELHSQDLLARVGLTAPQLAVLKALPKLETPTPTSLARELKLSQPTVSGILERLQAKGLVARTEARSDRRLHSYGLTETAVELLSKSPPLLQEHFRRRLLGLQDWERSALLSALQRLACLMDAESLEAYPVLTSGADPLGRDLEIAPRARTTARSKA